MDMDVNTDKGEGKQTDTLTLTWRGTVMCADRSRHVVCTILKTSQIHSGEAERHGIPYTIMKVPHTIIYYSK